MQTENSMLRELQQLRYANYDSELHRIAGSSFDAGRSLLVVLLQCLESLPDLDYGLKNAIVQNEVFSKYRLDQ